MLFFLSGAIILEIEQLYNRQLFDIMMFNQHDYRYGMICIIFYYICPLFFQIHYLERKRGIRDGRKTGQKNQKNKIWKHSKN